MIRSIVTMPPATIICPEHWKRWKKNAQ